MKFRSLPLIAFLSYAFPALADTIKLKSGEVIEGTVKSETNNSITVEVQFSPTIIDTRIIAKSDVEAINRLSKDAAAFYTLDAIEMPATIMDASVYNTVKARYAEFLRDYPDSDRAVDVRERLSEIEANEERLSQGEVKFDGSWLSASDYLAEKYQIDAAVLEAEMKRMVEVGNPGGALNLYEDLKKSYPHSIAFADAQPTARKAVSDLERRLEFELNNLPIKLEARALTVERTALADRERVRRALENEDARLKSIAADAKSAGRKFFEISSIDKAGLEQMRKSVDDVKRDLSRPELAQLEAKARTARAAIRQASEGEAATARAALDNLAASWSQYEGLARLKAKVAELETRLTAEPPSQAAEEKSPGAPSDSSPTATPAATPAPEKPDASGGIGL